MVFLKALVLKLMIFVMLSLLFVLYITLVVNVPKSIPIDNAIIVFCQDNKISL